MTMVDIFYKKRLEITDLYKLSQEKLILSDSIRHFFWYNKCRSLQCTEAFIKPVLASKKERKTLIRPMLSLRGGNIWSSQCWLPRKKEKLWLGQCCLWGMKNFDQASAGFQEKRKPLIKPCVGFQGKKKDFIKPVLASKEKGILWSSHVLAWRQGKTLIKPVSVWAHQRKKKRRQKKTYITKKYHTLTVIGRS